MKTFKINSTSFIPKIFWAADLGFCAIDIGCTADGEVLAVDDETDQYKNVGHSSLI